MRSLLFGLPLTVAVVHLVMGNAALVVATVPTCK
jgi:hypothetical protein